MTLSSSIPIFLIFLEQLEVQSFSPVQMPKQLPRQLQKIKMRRSEQSKEQVVTSEPIKNYYEILGVNPNATLRQIESAYQKMSLKWHPDKHTTDRRLAERKFQDVSEAFDVLSDHNRRSTYDRMISQKSSIENAYKVFDRFFGQNEMITEEEEKFFETYFPGKRKNYYKVLGVGKDASMEEITNAYRKLALKYHPKTNPNNEEAARKFVEINEAFQTLSTQPNRQTYDTLTFGDIVPRRAFDIFENFFEDKWRDMPSETELFQPIFGGSRRRSLMPSLWGETGRNGTRNPMLGISGISGISGLSGLSGMDLESLAGKELQNIKEGQCYCKEERLERKNGKENRSSQVIKRKIKNGEVEEEILKENVLPNGEKDVTKMLKRGDKVVDEKKYHLRKDEWMPKELTNF